MTAIRLHIARTAPVASQFDQDAYALLASVTPAAPVWSVESPEQAWALAQFVDLVEAGFGKKNALWRSTRQALARYVSAHWMEPACRAMCGRSACLAEFVDQELDSKAAH